MKKIRINELARELEIKAHEVLDRLPELGVTEKKTHSSSIDEDVAIKLRRLYGFDSPDLEPEAASAPQAEAESRPSVGVREPEKDMPAAAETAPSPEASAPPRTAEHPAPARGGVSPADRPSAPLSPLPPSPIRPPMAARPIHPPIGGQPAPPATWPEMPPAAPPGVARTPGIQPAKPLPGAGGGAPRPGQILSGPRQPFPATASGTGETLRPSPSIAAPPIPKPPAITRQAEVPGPARPSGGMPTVTSVPGAPQSRTLAGQPAARPVVPPRADLLKKLSAPRPTMPAPPAAPRPGAPRPPMAAPVPGQPIYRGPIRPGQPLVTKQVVRPGPPAAGRPVGPRPQHPTSRGRMEPGLAPPPVEQPRGRPGQRPGGRQQPRERTEEEK